MYFLLRRVDNLEAREKTNSGILRTIEENVKGEKVNKEEGSRFMYRNTFRDATICERLVIVFPKMKIVLKYWRLS